MNSEYKRYKLNAWGTHLHVCLFSVLGTVTVVWHQWEMVPFVLVVTVPVAWNIVYETKRMMQRLSVLSEEDVTDWTVSAYRAELATKAEATGHKDGEVKPFSEGDGR